MDRFKVMKDMYLSTSYSTWKNTFSTVMLLVFCISFVAIFGYLIFTIPSIFCQKIWFYFSILWLVVELAVISYLYFYKNIPRFAREAIVLLILMSNVWFAMFIFGLKECVA